MGSDEGFHQTPEFALNFIYWVILGLQHSRAPAPRTPANFGAGILNVGSEEKVLQTPEFGSNMGSDEGFHQTPEFRPLRSI